MNIGTTIGYVECLKFRYSDTSNSVTILTKGFVEDMGIAAYELRIADGALFVFKLTNNKHDLELRLVANNYIIKTVKQL